MKNSPQLDDGFLARLRLLPPLERLQAARESIEPLGKEFHAASAEALAGELRGTDAALLHPWLEALPDSAVAAFLGTQLLPAGARQLLAWERLWALEGKRDPFRLLGWARALAAVGEFEAAARKLRLALAEHPPYPFYARAEKLVRQVAHAGVAHLRQCRLAILGSSTTSLLVPVMEALLLRDGIQAEIYEAPYGSIQQESLDPASGLARFRPGIVILQMQWRDLELAGVTEEPEPWVARTVESYAALWQRLTQAFSCHVIQPAFDFPAEEPYGHLGGALRGGRTRLIELLNLRMREAAPPNVSVLDVPAVQREVGARRWENPGDWDRYRQHPAADTLPELADAQLAHVRAVLGLTRKVLVTDLDNTLWHGVIGEDGVSGIGIGPGTPAGEAHLRLQRYLLDLKRRGILLAVVSKNNPEDARLPFQEHPQMALRLEDFAGFRANWEDKAGNLRALAKDLSLGLDSFVFLDDNPLEREWVRSQLPEVAVVELDAAPFHYVRQLHRGRYFESIALSAEDLARAEQYRVEAQRESLRSTASSLDDFLTGLRLEASVAPVTDANLARVTQLVNKTNQFNVTTRRYSEAEVRALAQDAEGWAGAFHMSDCLGSYGLIGVLFCKPGAGERHWEIDTLLMSCRTLGRQMEKFMFDRMLDAAQRAAIQRITGVYRPTRKNAMVSRLFDDFGFRRVAASDAETRYEFDVPQTPSRTATHVRDVSALAGMAHR
jgi:FkbH-like protein